MLSIFSHVFGPSVCPPGEVSVQVFCPFFNWDFCLPGVKACEFFIYFRDQTLVFTDMSPKARNRKEWINKWDLMKLQSFCMAKENSIKMKRESTVWENTFANDTSDKGLISKIYNELTWLYSRKTNNPIEKSANTWTNTSPRRTYRGPRDTWKNAQHH